MSTDSPAKRRDELRRRRSPKVRRLRDAAEVRLKAATSQARAACDAAAAHADATSHASIASLDAGSAAAEAIASNRIAQRLVAALTNLEGALSDGAAAGLEGDSANDGIGPGGKWHTLEMRAAYVARASVCLLYRSDAADE